MRWRIGWLDPVPLVTMAILWGLLGVVLLALTHRREASALRAARAS